MILLWAILFLVISISIYILAYAGIAIALSTFTKFLFFVALIGFLIALILVVIEKMQKSKY